MIPVMASSLPDPPSSTSPLSTPSTSSTSSPSSPLHFPPRPPPPNSSKASRYFWPFPSGNSRPCIGLVSLWFYGGFITICILYTRLNEKRFLFFFIEDIFITFLSWNLQSALPLAYRCSFNGRCPEYINLSSRADSQSSDL